MTALVSFYPNISIVIYKLYIKMSEEATGIIENVLKLLGGALGVKLFDYWIEKHKARKEKKQTNVIIANLKDISDMDAIMANIVNNTKATSFLIFRGHDSGSVPNPKHPYYTRCLWQRTKDSTNVDKLTRRYEGLQVDVPYINMVISMLTYGSVKIKVNEMQDCLLKELYMSEGIKYSELYFLAQEKSNHIYYCAIATTEQTCYTDMHTRSDIDLAVGKLRQIFQRI